MIVRPRRAALRDRRMFLAGLPLLLVRTRPAFASRPSSVSVVAPDEPGTRLRLTGTIFQSDGVTPAPGARLSVYQTDAAGWYSRPVNNPRQARLRAEVWSDEKGRYEILTVEPGRYADQGSPPPKHIHVHLAPNGLPEHWIESYHFANDPSLPDRARRSSEGLGTFASVVAVSKSPTGRLEGRRDIRIDASDAERNRIVGDF